MIYIRDSKKLIYVSKEVGRMLYILSKAERHISTVDIKTPDEIADTMLRQAIREQFPELPKRLEEIDQLEKKIIKSIAKK